MTNTEIISKLRDMAAQILTPSSKGKCFFNEAANHIEALERALAVRNEVEVRRIKHLNRLATWAQQDPTGPICAHQIQEWVLNELKAALGSAYEPTPWQPETVPPVTKELEVK